MRTRAASSFSAAATVAVRTGVLLTLIAGAGLLAGCNDDGRVLRPSRPDQVGTVSTLATTTTGVGGADGDGVDGLGVGDEVDDAGSDEGFDGTLAPVSGAPAAITPQLTAPFADNGPIDPRYTCDGANLSPALSWTAAPTGTVEIALTMVDSDAPGFVHWALAGIDPLSTALGEGIVPEFAIQGLNSSGTPGYTGPCPPTGSHRYEFTVHYLAQQTELGDGAAGADLLAAIDGATFALARLTGTYSRG